VQIVTPYPRTPLTEEIRRRYGIRDEDLSRYNSRNLVWNHPRLAPEELTEIQQWANRQLHDSRRALRTLEKVMIYDATRRVSSSGVRRLVQGLLAGSRSERQREGVRSTRAWARAGWYAYEESPRDAGASRPFPQRPATRSEPRRLPIWG
jgi:hypothetical protein